MSIKKRRPIKYNDGRTKQAFKDQCDINLILKKAQRTGAISHLNKHEGSYGDFADFDFFEAQTQLAKAGQIFDELPSEVKREFDQNPSKFFEYANNPDNVGRLAELLPEIAQPGTLATSPMRTAASEAALDAASGVEATQGSVTDSHAAIEQKDGSEAV